MSTKTIVKSDFSERLKELRTSLGHTQSRMAQEIGLKQQAWGNYESGHAKPSFDVLQRLSVVIGVSVDWLIAGEGPMFREQSASSGEEVIREPSASYDRRRWLMREVSHLRDELKQAARPEEISADLKHRLEDVLERVEDGISGLLTDNSRLHGQVAILKDIVLTFKGR